MTKAAQLLGSVALALAAFFIPALASAATFNPACSDFTFTAVTCSSGTLTFPGGVSTQAAQFSGFSMSSGQTYYYKYMLVRSNSDTAATNWWTIKSWTSGAPTISTTPDNGTYSGSFTTSSADTGMQWRSFGSAGHRWAGTVSGICISDSPTGCDDPVPPAPGGAVGMYASSTALSQVSGVGSSVGLLIAAAVATLIAAIGSLYALGFFKRKASQYVAGRKF